MKTPQRTSGHRFLTSIEFQYFSNRCRFDLESWSIFRAGCCSLALCAVSAIACAQPGSPQCNVAKKSVAVEQANVNAFEATRNNPDYAGPAQTLYFSKLKQLQGILSGGEAIEEIDCSAQAAAVEAGEVKPTFIVLTLVYAPPGTSSGKSSSYVEYSNGTSLASTVSVSKSFKSDYDITAGVSVGSKASNGASVSLGVDWTDMTTNKTEITIQQTAKNDLKVGGAGADGIDHDDDEVYIWINPIVNVSVQGKKLIYSLGIDPSSSDPNAMDITYLYVGELKNPSLIKDDRAARLAARGFTSADYKQILSVDPFANGSAPIDPKRFVQTSTTFTYVPPFQPGAAASYNALTLTNESINTATTSEDKSTSLDLEASVNAGVSGIAVVTVSTADKWTWTNSNSYSISNSATSSATASIGQPSYGYTGVSDIAVYQDTLFNSFMFAPNPVTTTITKGTVHSASKQAVADELVTLKIPGRVFRTYTDSTGSYHFLGVPPKGKAIAGTITVRAVSKPVSIGGSVAAVDIEIPPAQLPAAVQKNN
ncbi:carboxypeptidase-like regulatory domain-containing protein [Paraburkholderia agricolaris]|uniref:Carboxypeptidase-like regulatory domain-containing protein n=1 Tax=Paraburkholderia agricolaris TaxID=2152888 RepID=A0ABW9A2U2_9BURK